MIPKSIRWRLPMSYAAIALVAALSLGLVLLTILQTFYRQQELDYLTDNAQAISATLAPLVEAGLPSEALQSQLSSYAFLSQTRIRLLDASDQVLADSGNPQKQQQEVLALSVEYDVEVEADIASQTVTQTVTVLDKAGDYTSFILLRNEELEAPLESAGVLVNLGQHTDDVGEEQNVFRNEKFTITASQLPDLDALIRRENSLLSDPYFISGIPVAGTPYGFGLGSNRAVDGPRSPEIVRHPFYGEAGNLLGYVELSEGPAYGRQILDSVAWGWAIAGSVAVLLAGAVGWVISRRLSAPLLDLTEVTTRMAAGDLSVRANVSQHGPGEFGTLSQSFNHMAQRVEETVVTLRRFVADAAHELHTPLTALHTNLELTADNISPEQHPLLEQAQAQVTRLESLASDLIDLSRLETGTKAEVHTSFDLATLLQDICELYASQAEQADQSFVLYLPEEEASFTTGSDVQLRRAISNLLDNALKFMPNGGRIEVGLRSSSDDRWLEIWVEDTGIGIPDEDLPQLFSRFHRGRNAAPYPGSGLGLAIVKAIVEGHRGKVVAENTGNGACFIMYLPQKDI